ncbi:hypothetical protein [Flavobacterium sp.]|uniref:hypothetical protein n=1 Tax=Flavobacterium sp. TaxID=239 RepID=UPI0028BDFA81|nr:hypothetical protein [Flavobacterium sp.]
MKSSIIYLGIALITFSNVITATGQQSEINNRLTQLAFADGNVKENRSSSETTKNEKALVSSEIELITFPTYQKTMEEIIAENNQITENVLNTTPTEKTEIEVILEMNRINNEKTMEEIISEDNLIIENDFSNKQPIAVIKPKEL